MTLAEIITRHEQATSDQPSRHPAAGAITPRGHAAIALYRFVRQLRALNHEDRAHVVAMLTEELATLAAEQRARAALASGMRLLGCTHAASCASVAECHERAV